MKKSMLLAFPMVLLLLCAAMGSSVTGADTGQDKKSFAADNSNPVPLFRYNQANCGSGGLPSPADIGFVNFHFQDNAVHVNVHIRNAVPNATYNVVLIATNCSSVLVIGTVGTNNKGVGNGNFIQTAPIQPYFIEVETGARSDFANTPSITP